MKINNKVTTRPFSRNKGAATLLMAVIVGFLILLISVFASRVGIREQRISANDARYKEAFAASEAGMENALRFVKHNKGLIEAGVDPDATPATTFSRTLTPPDTGILDYTVLISSNDKSRPITIQSTGVSADGAGTSDTQVLVSYYSPAGRSNDLPDVPFITGGTATISGSLEIIGNSNGAGTGVPVSIWAHDLISLSGAATGTCQLDGYLVNGGITPSNDADKQLCAPTNCTCSGTLDARVSSTADGKGADIVDNDPLVTDDPAGNFPPDLFEYLFGVPRAEWKQIYDISQVLPDCSSLNAQSEGYYWITGDCTIASNVGVGNMDDPATDAFETRAVVIIIEEGQTILRGGATVFGVIYSFDKDDNDVTGGIAINGNAIVYGVFAADTGVSISNGTLQIRYNKHILRALFSDKSEDDDGGNFGGTCGGTSAICEVGRVIGTWQDFPR